MDQQNIEQGYAKPQSLIEVQELQERIEGLESTVLIDVRKPIYFANGHIEGAVNIWRDQITDTSYNYGGMMATKEQMESLLSGLGVKSSDTLILYDAKGNVDAARLWWILKYYGHQQVRLLNGGLKAWESIGGKLVSSDSKRGVSEYNFLEEVNPEIHASISQVKSSFGSSEQIILDTRSEEEFSGSIKKKGAARSGAIPHSVNLDWSAAVNYDGDHRFRSINELKKIYGELGIDSNSKVITYCHSGVRSAHTLFVLQELLGYSSVKNYDGSWTEWSHLETP